MENVNIKELLSRLGGKKIGRDSEKFRSYLMDASCIESLSAFLLDEWSGYGGDSGFGRLFLFDEILELNTDFRTIDASMLLVGNGANGDFNVIDLLTGKIGWLPISLFGYSSEELRGLAIFVDDNIVNFYWDSFNNKNSVPFDYWKATEYFPSQVDSELLNTPRTFNIEDLPDDADIE